MLPLQASVSALQPAADYTADQGSGLLQRCSTLPAVNPFNPFP